MTRDARRVSTDILSTFIGKASSLTEGCDLARFHLRSLHDAHDRWAFVQAIREALADLDQDKPVSASVLTPLLRLYAVLMRCLQSSVRGT